MPLLWLPCGGAPASVSQTTHLSTTHQCSSPRIPPLAPLTHPPLLNSFAPSPLLRRHAYPLHLLRRHLLVRCCIHGYRQVLPRPHWRRPPPLPRLRCFHLPVLHRCPPLMHSLRFSRNRILRMVRAVAAAAWRTRLPGAFVAYPIMRCCRTLPLHPFRTLWLRRAT